MTVNTYWLYYTSFKGRGRAIAGLLAAPPPVWPSRDGGKSGEMLPLRDRYCFHLAHACTMTREMGGSSVCLAYCRMETENISRK
jgi:hypothetical protein